MAVEKIIAAIATTAQKWINIEYGPRVSAMEATLELDNGFTVESLHFAINQQMNELTSDGLFDWLGGRSVGRDVTVGVLNPGNVPLADLQDLIGAVLLGVSYRGSQSSRSPHLLPAFVNDLKRESPDLAIEFVNREDLLVGADKFIATGMEHTLEAMRHDVAQVGLSKQDILLRGPGFGMGIVTGSESTEQLERLAEDILLHDGAGCRSVALIWAPVGYEPDNLLDSMASFRAVFPCSPRIPGRIEIQRAYLAAIEFPHAYSDDKSFLVSKGDPEIQQPGHVRLTEYRSQEEIWSWVRSHYTEIQVIVAGDDYSMITDSRIVSFGEAQRPTLGWKQSGRDVIDFLAS